MIFIRIKYPPWPNGFDGSIKKKKKMFFGGESLLQNTYLFNIISSQEPNLYSLPKAFGNPSINWSILFTIISHQRLARWQDLIWKDIWLGSQSSIPISCSVSPIPKKGCIYCWNMGVELAFPSSMFHRPLLPLIWRINGAGIWIEMVSFHQGPWQRGLHHQGIFTMLVFINRSGQGIYPKKVKVFIWELSHSC